MFLIVELGRRMTAPVETLWGEVGLTPTEGLLLARLMVTHNGRARSGDLVDYPIRSTAALAKVLAGLETNGLITRTRRQDDGRGIDIEATPGAHALFRSVFARISNEVAGPTAQPLTKAELEDLEALLRRLTPPADSGA